MELVSHLIVEPVVKPLTGYITEKLRNFTCSAERVKEMKDKMKVLDGQRIDNENHLRRNHADYKEIPARVEEWLEEVKKIKEDVENDGCFDLKKKMRRNGENNREIPDRVPESLEEVEKIKEDADNNPTNNDGCFNIKKKYLAGRNALRHIKDIERLIKESSEMIWSDAPIGFGRVDSKRLASTSGGGTQNLFKSRDKPFNDALKLLQQNDHDAARVIALCGMGGVGKTTLMNQLKEVAKNEKMFNCIVKAVIGNTPNLLDIQKVIAADTGAPLTETNVKLMATCLSKRFEEFSKSKEKILVILDDVWKESKIKLEDIGLASPLPYGFKLLLTSRDAHICRQIAVDADSALEEVKVDFLEEGEAHDFFFRIAGNSARHDRDLSEIGCEIVKKCGCLPLAIKIIAATLKCEENMSVWRRTLDRLKRNDLEEKVQEIIEISYDSLEREDKAIFLLCGLFPEDSNIPIEDLTRYAWGLKLLKQVSTMGNARDSTQTSVSNLKNKYLLMDGDSRHSDCVKMHDLVLAFAVATVSKGDEDGCWIIHHEDFSKWSEADNSMSQSCTQISLACKGMSEFPTDFKFPDLRVLKLVQGDESLRFSESFYVGMEELQVIAFEKMKYSLVPTSSAKLRTLCLDECSLTFDLACIGNLSNLEVLSFANSCITIIPSTFGNLKKLRLLDVTGCYNLVIDDGVLKSLVKLEELYMRSFDGRAELEKLYNMRSLNGRAVCFTDNNCSELAERSKNLRALEFEFIGDNAHMKNMSYEKLKRFKLSVGCYFTEVRDDVETNQVDMHSYENSLKLITNREELLKSKMNELFKITDALYLQVDDMNILEDVDVEYPHPQHPPQNSSFYNLRLLVISECPELKYLFTLNVATTLSKLEYLDISRCPIMEAVIYTENDGSDIIKFSNLKYIRLADLPKLLSFSNRVNVIELPLPMELKLRGLPKVTSIYPIMQSFFHEDDATPKLEKLFVSDMGNLKEIWPPQFSNLCPLRELTVEGCDSIEVLFNMDFGEIEQLSSSLRSIKVKRCDSLVKLFSCNPFPFLNNLQELSVESCGSIQVLFNTDLGRACTSEELVCSSSLRSIKVSQCDSLVNLLPSNPMPLFNHLEKLEVLDCASIEVIFEIDIGCVGEMDKVSSSNLRSIEVKRCDSLVKLFSCNLFPFLNNLQELKVESCGSIQVLFNTDLGRAGKSEEQVCSSSLRSIVVEECDSLVNLLPSNPMPLFNHLEELDVRYCASIEVIFDIEMGCVGEMDKVSSSSRLRRITLERLRNLREVWRIKDAGNNLIHGFEAIERIRIEDCERFENIITPATTTFDTKALKEVEINGCGRERERSYELVKYNQDQEIKVISKVALPSYLLHTFHHLHKLSLRNYKAAEVVFEITTPSSRESPHNTQRPPILPYLENLELKLMGGMSHVWKCDWNEFLILQKPQSQSSFHNLTTISMYKCHSIKYLFSPLMAKLLSSLKKVDIWQCDGIEEVVSNRDDEDTSLYSHINTSLFPHLDILELENLRSFKCIGGGANGISGDIHDQLKLSSWSLCQYAREIRVIKCDALSSVVPLYAVGQMQKLHVLEIWDCKSMTKVFETKEINNMSDTDTGKSLPRLEYITMFKLPKLKVLKIQGCNLLEHIFTFSTLQSLTQLQELEVKDCKAMEVIVTEENGEHTTASASVVVDFSHLKSLILVNLPNFVGFFLGKNEFTWPALENVVIDECPNITVFTYGQSTALRLNYINTSLGNHSVECGLDFRVTTTSHQARLPSYESSSSYSPTTIERLPWSYHNLIEADMNNNPCGGQTLFSSDKLLQLQKLETVRCWDCQDIEQIFDSETVAEIPKLRQVELWWLRSLKYIWKSKHGTVLKFPNLTRLSIDKCDSLEYLFTCSMVGSLLQLQELHISNCDSMKVIVKGEEEECDAIVNAIVVFPCLKSLKLESLDSLEGFCLGKEAFEFPSLDTLQITGWCPKMTVFTKGDLSAPKLYAISSNWDRKYNIHNRLNSVIKNFSHRIRKRD